MKKIFLSMCILLALLVCTWTAKCVAELLAENTLSKQMQQVESVPVQTEAAPEPAVPVVTVPETTAPTEVPTVPETSMPTETAAETTIPAETVPVYAFTEEEEKLLLKLAMAERGDTGCTTCMAMVMRTVLNRVESDRFSSTIKGVIYAQNQFTPVMDGSFETTEPDWLCAEALKMVQQGWDESQGALYYEWSVGETWHSQNLKLLFTHCDTKFYSK